MLAAGAPMPAAISQQAEPADDEAILWLAFWELASTRAYQGAPIGWATVHMWATCHGFDAITESELGAVVRALDQGYLEHWRREAAKAPQEPPRADRRKRN